MESNSYFSSAESANSAKQRVRAEITAFGVPDTDPRLLSLEFHELFNWEQDLRDSFREVERVWWETHISPSTTEIIDAALDRYAVGGRISFPFVARAVDYSTFGSYPDVPIKDSRVMLDRGLEVAKDAQSLHFVLIAGLKQESQFDRSLSPESQDRLVRYADALRRNRPLAEQGMLETFGNLPPNRGEEYDAMPFTICERRIAYEYWTRKDDPSAVDRTIVHCESMIGRSDEFIKLFSDLDRPLPTHLGFKQLSILLGKQGSSSEALTLCRQANLEGWDGDWQSRIQRLETKVRR